LALDKFSTPILFADDTSVIISESDPFIFRNKLNGVFKTLNTRFNNNLLSLNFSFLLENFWLNRLVGTMSERQQERSENRADDFHSFSNVGGGRMHRPFQYRGGRGKPQNRPRAKPESLRIAPPLPKVPEGVVPTPKKPLTEDSPLRNDPMWLDFDDHGFSGMMPYRGENTFATTTEGFIPLVDREFDLIGSVDRTFTKFVSKSMWAYYCTQHLYARCIAVLRHKGRTTHAEERFADSQKNWFGPRSERTCF
jgi:hypothetical protein